jgi:hypothetical protein
MTNMRHIPSYGRATATPLLDQISHRNDDYGQIIHDHEPLIPAGDRRRSARANPSAVALGGMLGLAVAVWSLVKN